MRPHRPSLAAALAELRTELLAPIETALDTILRGSGALADVRRWLRAGPHGHGELLLSWARLSIEADGLRRELDATRQRADSAERRADAQRTHGHERELELRAIIDDLAIRILGATLEIGRVAHVDVELASRDGTFGTGTEVVGYSIESVDRLLETARQALDVADDTARYASARRRGAARYLRTERPTTVRTHTLEGALRRIAALIGQAHRTIPRTTDATQALDTLTHARDLAHQALEEHPSP